MLKTIKIDLEYQQMIAGPPTAVENLHKQACVGDGVTMDSWRDKWIGNYQKTKDHFGDLGKHSFGQLHGVNRHRPVICIGSGPSLKESLEALKKNQEQPNPVLTVSCLHNFGYFEDNGIYPDYYFSLDAGDLVLSDISENRKQKPEWYWDRTKDRKLIAGTFTDSVMWEKWQGETFLFNSLTPEHGTNKALKEIEPFNHYVSSGGNAGGGAMYTAKAVMGSSTIIYVGYDMCFDYDNTFHAYKTQYDNFKGGGTGGCVKWPDVYGVPRKSWPSYVNFKHWLDWVACSIPGQYINCSGGILGAYVEGNIAQYRYMSLKDALMPYQMADVVYKFKVEKGKPDVLDSSINLGEYYGNPKAEIDFTLF